MEWQWRCPHCEEYVAGPDESKEQVIDRGAEHLQGEHREEIERRFRGVYAGLCGNSHCLYSFPTPDSGRVHPGLCCPKGHDNAPWFAETVVAEELSFAERP